MVLLYAVPYTSGFAAASFRSFPCVESLPPLILSLSAPVHRRAGAAPNRSIPAPHAYGLFSCQIAVISGSRACLSITLTRYRGAEGCVLSYSAFPARPCFSASFCSFPCVLKYSCPLPLAGIPAAADIHLSVPAYCRAGEAEPQLPGSPCIRAIFLSNCCNQRPQSLSVNNAHAVQGRGGLRTVASLVCVPMRDRIDSSAASFRSFPCVLKSPAYCRPPESPPPLILSLSAPAHRCAGAAPNRSFPASHAYGLFSCQIAVIRGSLRVYL